MIEIDKLVAGPALDALVAEKVMRWEMFSIRHPGLSGEPSLGFDPERLKQSLKCPGGYTFWTMNGARPVPKYSTEIAAAWEVVEFLRAKGKTLTICSSRRGFDVEHFPGSWESAESAPLAICRAALKAVGA